MGISEGIDISQLELVQNFKGFLMWMQDPDKYKALLTETERLLGEQKKYLGLIKTKEQADDYLATAHAKIATWVKEDEKTRAEFTASQERQTAEVMANLEKSQATLKEAQDKQKAAAIQIESATANSTVVSRKLVELKAREHAITAGEVELAAQKESLARKISQVDKMLKE